MKKALVFILIYCVITALTFWSAVRILYQPFISVIISVYNYESYISTTIESVLKSSLQDFEVIIVNDGSTDNSLYVIQKYAKNNSKITVIDQKNQGLSIARNNAMKIAKGKYVWFVDADDFIDVSAIEKMKTAILRSKNATQIEPDIVSFYIKPVNHIGIPSEEKVGYYSLLPRELMQHQITPFQGNQIPHYVLPYYPATSSKQIYRLKYLQDKQIQFIPHLVFEDEVFFATTLASGAKGIIIPQVLYYKRSHGASITHNRPRYYDSTVRLPRISYQEIKKIGGSEELARFYFDWHFSGVFSKWPNQQKFIPILKELLAFIQNQPNDDFWEKHKNRLQSFILEQEIKQ
ncbi:MAG: glycosyltransferase [Alphaproteobacteria bacterium]|nr:glycosyltransferase [Alphaproteobacteria bacterium]